MILQLPTATELGEAKLALSSRVHSTPHVAGSEGFGWI